MTFTVPSGDLQKALSVLERARTDIEFDMIQHDQGLAKVSVIGIGMRSHTGVAASGLQRRWPTRASTSAPSPRRRSRSPHPESTIPIPNWRCGLCIPSTVSISNRARA